MKSKNAYSKIIAKAWSDPKFKERLLKDPEYVLQEQGVEVPKGKKLQVHENNEKIVHLVIPEKPQGDMSTQELKSVAAGFSFTGPVQPS